MADQKISGNNLLRAAEKVRAQREAAAVGKVAEPKAVPHTSTTAQVRATLNWMPGSDELSGLIDKALTALSRGVRWARGSIVNLLV